MWNQIRPTAFEMGSASRRWSKMCVRHKVSHQTTQLDFQILLVEDRHMKGHCKRQCAESCKKRRNQQAYAVTNSSKFKNKCSHGHARVTEESWSKTGSTKLRNPRVLLRTKREVSGKSVADSRVSVFDLISPLGLLFI